MQFQDKTLTCRDCGQEFVWTAGEQEFYEKQQYTNPPSRCPACRAKRKQERFANGGDDRRGGFHGGDRGPRKMYKVHCADCGVETEVPFEPKEGRPVYCREHFMQHNPRPQ
ncbi:MAG TPA: zinc-ribbon domain containing protein [Patescibacteria group bacterium]|nr:zinc-ribbon domain containing protein [Patescibacteria group bacterium]